MSPIRVLVHAPAPGRATWIEAELTHRAIMVQLGLSLSQVVSALIDDPPPRPQILVVDFDAIPPAAVMDLHILRTQGWFGRILAIGDVQPSLCASLTIDTVLSGPLAQGSLRRQIVADTSAIVVTSRMPVI